MIAADLSPASGTAPPRVRWAEMVLPCAELQPTLDFFVERLGFRIELIFPADEPRAATLSGHGLWLRLEPGEGSPGVIRLACDDPGPADARSLVAPNGTRIEFVPAAPPVEVPPLRPAFVITRRADGPGEGVGRAGMIYRDLIPGRLGGRFIASHIALPDGGPVADWVHYHRIAWQLIFCRRGWARLVYEDQGPPFLMRAGDLVLQPPTIRHRVLETSAGFEVVELGSPAVHETLADHAMTLPTGRSLPDRDYGGQRFLHSVAAETPWRPSSGTGFERRDTGLGAATGGVADACVLRPGTADRLDAPAHAGELLFGFVLEGRATLEARGAHPLEACDAFVIPAGEPWSLSGCSPDLQLLRVAAPA